MAAPTLPQDTSESTRWTSPSNPCSILSDSIAEHPRDSKAGSEIKMAWIQILPLPFADLHLLSLSIVSWKGGNGKFPSLSRSED